MNPKTASSSVSYAQTSSEISSWSIKELLADSAKEWNLSQTMIIVILLIPLFVGLTGVATALMGKAAYKWFTGEDRFAENLQVLFWVLTFVLGFGVMRHLWNAGYKTIALLYLCLNIGIFFIVGEELSWGQRIFGWETSETMKAINKQKETNLHNIEGVGDTFKLLHLVIGAYGTIFPLAFMFMQSPALGRYREVISMLVPHYVLVPYFFTAFIWRIQATFWHPPKKYYFTITEFSEVIELILCIAFFLFMIFQLKKTKRLLKA